MGVDTYYFYHGFGLKAFEGRHIIIVYINQLFNEVTVVKELRSKMFGEHPRYFKAVFLKKT
jgi:hypothetical protein